MQNSKLIKEINAIDSQIAMLAPNVSFGQTTIEQGTRFDDMLEGAHSEHIGKVNSSTHVILYYDYNSDELNEQIKDKNKHHELFNQFDKLYVDDIRAAYNKLGYELVEEHDGSGNGLFYGSILLRKPYELWHDISIDDKQIKVECEFMPPHEILEMLNNKLLASDDFKARVLEVMPNDFQACFEAYDGAVFGYGSEQLFECCWTIVYSVAGQSTTLVISNFS